MSQYFLVFKTLPEPLSCNALLDGCHMSQNFNSI